MRIRSDRRARPLALGTVAAVTAVALAACTPSASGGSDPTDGARTLTVWHYYSVDDQIAALDAFKASFEAAHSDVTVDNVYVPQDQINSKVVTAAGSGTGPDIVVFDGYSATTLIQGGALAPLDNYWADFEGASEIAEGAVTSVDGQIYSVQGYVNTLALFYNKDILDEVGVEPPATLEELESALAAVTGAGYEGIVLSGQPDVQGAFQAYPWMTAEGFSYDDPQSAPLQVAFDRARGWVENGWLSQQAATWDQNVPFTQFTAGGIAFAENGNWQLAGLTADASFDWGVVKLPVGPTGKVYLGGEAQGIGVHSADPDLAWEYLSETFFSEEGQLVALDKVGAIPTRADAAAAEIIAADPHLSVYAEAIAEQGAPFPDTAIPPANNEATILAAGQAWSAALGGQTSTADAVGDLLGKLESLLDAG